MKYTILRDQQEKKNYWHFPAKSDCLGTETVHLKTADYCIKEYPNGLLIERKKTTGELAQNIFEDRFERELIRMDEFTHPFMIFEFTLNDIMNFPVNSGIPKYLWHKLKMNKNLMLKTIHKYSLLYRCKIIFAGQYGQDQAERLIKNYLEYVQPWKQNTEVLSSE